MPLAIFVRVSARNAWTVCTAMAMCSRTMSKTIRGGIRWDAGGRCGIVGGDSGERQAPEIRRLGRSSDADVKPVHTQSVGRLSAGLRRRPRARPLFLDIPAKPGKNYLILETDRSFVAAERLGSAIDASLDFGFATGIGNIRISALGL